jgi:phosphohistidine phosphatase SixA
MDMHSRRDALLGSVALFAWLPPLETAASDAAWATLKQDGVVIFRHALAPGTGDPAGFRIGDCATQRNLNEAGRAQARRIGEEFAARGVKIGAVVSSQWCRAIDTAKEAFGKPPAIEPAFNSFFDDRGASEAQTAKARAILRKWKGPGTLVVVTHQVNITALTGIFPDSGEGLVLGKGLEIQGRIQF